MHRLMFIVLVFYALLIQQSVGTLLQQPRDTTVVRGKDVSFPCSTSEKLYVHWHHVPVESNERKDVFISNMNIDTYFPRFQVNKNETKGEYNLTISGVQPNDAGKYICVDKAGSGEERNAQLIVLDSQPVVHSNVSLDSFAISLCQDDVYYISLYCFANYTGNIPLELEWRQMPASLLINNDTKDQNKPSLTSVESNITVTVNNRMAGYWYECRSIPSHISGTSKPLNIQYARTTRKELTNVDLCPMEVQRLTKNESHQNCHYESNAPCNYRVIDLESSHNCTVSCSVGDKRCNFSEIICRKSTEKYKQNIIIIIIVSVIFIIVVIAGFIGFAFYCYKRRNRRHNRRPKESVQNEAERCQNPPHNQQPRELDRLNPTESGQNEA